MIAREGVKEILAATVLLAGAGGLLTWLVSPYLVLPLLVLWIWVLAFFRDPVRRGRFGTGELCAPADGTVTEVSELRGYGPIPGPAVRIGIFLSLFNVHVNRFPCVGRVRGTTYKKGLFLDARHPESGARNESNTLVIDPDPPIPGPVVVRQVAGLVARRIICHAKTGDHFDVGDRFGMIKFGSRTELIVPRDADTEVLVKIGEKVRGGLTALLRCSAPAAARHVPDGATRPAEAVST
jgi:phosphatidylserine decarboxylase